MPTGTRKRITQAPEVTPTNGLVSAVGLGVDLPASDPLDPDNRWTNGYVLEGLACKGTFVASAQACAAPGSDVPSEWEAEYVTAEGEPFLVGAAVQASTFCRPGSDQHQRMQTEAAARLELCQWNDIASELWTGAQAIAEALPNRWLASTDTTVLASGDPVSAIEAFATVEDHLAVCKCGAVRCIHVPVKLVPTLSTLHLIHTVGSRLFTDNGSLVIADPGYPGTSPTGDDPTSTNMWIYGTGPLTARIEKEIMYPEPDWPSALRVRDNVVQIRAQRRAAINWLCCAFGVNVAYNT